MIEKPYPSPEVRLDMRPPTLTLDECSEVTGAEKKRLVELNPDTDPDELFFARQWSFDEFAKPNLPIIIGQIENKEAFSKPNGIRVLDMPLRMPDQGWKIPPELEQFTDAIREAVRYEKMINPHFEDFYCYVTIDQKDVAPQVSQRRLGWHTDAFVTNETGVQIDVVPQDKEALGYMTGEEAERTYIATDALPTLFLEGPFDLSQVNPEEHHKVEDTFREIAEHKEPFEHPPYTMLRLDPFTVHSARVNETDQTIPRTFIKIQFSRYKYNRVGDTHNPHFDYNWAMAPRVPNDRGHRNIIFGEQKKLNEQFQAVNPAILFDKNVSLASIDWIDPHIKTIQKKESVTMRPATEGEEVTTTTEGHVISMTVAPKDSVVVTTPRGQTYCLTKKQFAKYYEPKPGANGSYAPQTNPKKVVIVTKDVRLYGPWGGMQYVKAGSALVINSKHDIYGIHPADYAAAYQEVEA